MKIWGFADGMASPTPLAILGIGFILANMFGVLNRKKRPILISLRTIIFHSKYPWIEISAMALASVGIVWVYLTEHEFTVRILGLMVFFTTVYYCIDIGKDAGPIDD